MTVIKSDYKTNLGSWYANARLGCNTKPRTRVVGCSRNGKTELFPTKPRMLTMHSRHTDCSFKLVERTKIITITVAIHVCLWLYAGDQYAVQNIGLLVLTVTILKAVRINGLLSRFYATHTHDTYNDQGLLTSMGKTTVQQIIMIIYFSILLLWFYICIKQHKMVGSIKKWPNTVASRHMGGCIQCSEVWWTVHRCSSIPEWVGHAKMTTDVFVLSQQTCVFPLQLQRFYLIFCMWAC